MEQLIKGKIYCIRNKVNDKVYVGSTIQSLSQRLSSHRREARFKNRYQLHNAFHQLGFDNFYIELIENYNCDTKEELKAREQHYIRLYDCFNNGYNSRCATTDEIKQEEIKIRKAKDNKEYYNHNKDSILEYHKEYFEKNKDYINKRNRKYDEIHKESLQKKEKE